MIVLVGQLKRVNGYKESTIYRYEKSSVVVLAVVK